MSYKIKCAFWRKHSDMKAKYYTAIYNPPSSEAVTFGRHPS